MQEDVLLQKAISTARAGRELTAREIFLDIVRMYPKNEQAWMWLTGLLDELDDRINACERTLEINPNNARVQQYLAQLLEQRANESDREKLSFAKQAQEAREALRSRPRLEVLEAVRLLTRQKFVAAESWRLLAELSPDLDERVNALGVLTALDPEDKTAASQFAQLKHFQENPLDLAAYYEEEGAINEAIAIYRRAALNPDMKKQWDELYWKILRLEKMKSERVAYVSPRVSILRLMLGPALLFTELGLIHIGINPAAYSEPIFYLGLPWVILGGFMIAFATVNSHNRLWLLLFKDPSSSRSPKARLIVFAAGWLVVTIPYYLLYRSALFRFFSMFSD
jgi:tetratricopeptide (TPR) repeat protein